MTLAILILNLILVYFIFRKDKKLTLSRYKLEKIIGRGGFSQVWKGEDKISKEKVAVKIMYKAELCQRNSIQNVLNELDLLRKIQHP